MRLFKIVLIVVFLFNLAPSFAGNTDHSTFAELKKAFKSGPEVTEACLECHENSAKEIHKTLHWNWEVPGAEGKLGKKNVINNFCVANSSNEPRCTSCHIGYGWKDKSFDFSSEKNVDCLVCHDQTGEYKKFPTGAGHPAYKDKKFGKKTFKAVDLAKVAGSVGMPNRNNCGSCHFNGGGGEGVKHANLDGSLKKPNHELDVHMDSEGLNFSCQECHTTQDHKISGRMYNVASTATCESCHDEAPHAKDKINKHMDKVACQTCHIPSIKGKPTKMWWDWSKAGKFKNDVKGKENIIVRKREDGKQVYNTKKGEFRWSEPNETPEYFWYNGTIEYLTTADKIDGSKTLEVNQLNGKAGDPNSKIWPMKVHRGKQVYDPVLRNLVVPKLFGPKGSDSYWTAYDWKKSVQAGMDYIGVEFSGELDFVETEMYWPITHMVAPKEQALKCTECHKTNGRLASLGDFSFKALKKKK